MKKGFGLLLLSFLLCGCAGRASYTVRPSAVPEKIVTKTAIPPFSDSQDSLPSVPLDPWQHCASVTVSGTSLQKVSQIEDEEFRRRVQITFLIQDAETETAYITERCMNGEVYVCNVDGRTNCMEKLDFTTEPNESMRSFCGDTEKDGAILSSAVTGMNSAYEWRCHEGTAVITAQIADPDADGYDKSVWFEIPQPITIRN